MKLRMKKVVSLVLAAAIIAVSAGKGNIKADAATKPDMSMIPKEDRENYWLEAYNGGSVEYFGEGPVFYAPGGIRYVIYINNSLKIKSAVFTKDVEEINGYIFAGTSIKTAYIPNLKTINGNPFDGSMLESLTVAKDNKYLCIEGKTIYSKDKKTLYAIQADKDGVVVIPEGVEEIGYGAVSSDAKKIVYPKSLTTISSGAFAGCSKLKSLTFPEWITEIDSYAFSGCTGLTSVTFTNNITKIDSGAFKGCTGLTSITFKEGLTKIGNSAFEGCSLKSITFSDTITEVGGRAFADNYIYYPTFPKNMTVLKGTYEGSIYAGNPITTMVIPEGIEEIGYDAFKGIDNLKSVVLPKSLKTASYYDVQDFDLYLDTGATIEQMNKVFKKGIEDGYVPFYITGEKELKAVKAVAKWKAPVITPTHSNNSLKFSWKPVEGATGYHVYILLYKDKKFRDASTRCVSYQLIGANSTSLNVKELEYTELLGIWEERKINLLKEVKDFHVYVVPYKEVNGRNIEGQYGMELLQNGAVKKDIDKLTVKGTDVTVSVKDMYLFNDYNYPDWSIGYQVYVSSSKNGKYEKVATTYSNKDTKITLPKGTHYVKIRYFEKIGVNKIYTWFAPYSSVKTVTVK